MKLQKSLYVGLSALMIASVGGLSQGNNINAKRRTKVVRITHLKKWQHNKLNHAKYLRNRNNRKINSIKHYLKHHKRGRYTKNQHKLLNRLNKQNKNLNTQIYKMNFKRINIKPITKKHSKKRAYKSINYNGKHNIHFSTISADQFQEEYNNAHGNLEKILKTPQQVDLDKEEIIQPLKDKNDVKSVEHTITRDQQEAQKHNDPFARNKEIARQMAAKTQADNAYVQNEINNSMSPSAQQQFNNMRNTDSIYQKAYNDTEPQYQQANNNLQQTNQNAYDLTTGTGE